MPDELLAKELTQEPHQQAKAEAQQDHRRDGDVDTQARALDPNVTRQMPKPCHFISGKPHHEADGDQDQAKSDEAFAKICHGMFALPVWCW